MASEQQKAMPIQPESKLRVVVDDMKYYIEFNSKKYGYKLQVFCSLPIYNFRIIYTSSRIRVSRSHSRPIIRARRRPGIRSWVFIRSFSRLVGFRPLPRVLMRFFYIMMDFCDFYYWVVNRMEF
jgi:hypothetical protein